MNKLGKLFLCALLTFSCFFYFDSEFFTIKAFNQNQTYMPNSLISFTNIVGSPSHLELDDDVDFNDLTTLKAADNTLDTSVDVAFEDSVYPLKLGAGLQKVRVNVSSSSFGGNYPSVILSLYENRNGTRVQIGTNQTFVMTQDVQIFTFNFDAASLTNKTGKDLEMKIIGKASSGSVANKRTVYFKSVNFDAIIDIPVFGTPPDFKAERYTSRSVTLSWSPVKDVVTYELFRDNVSIYNGNNPSFTDSGLSKDTSYVYKLIAHSSSNASPPVQISVKTARYDWDKVSSSTDHNLALKDNGTLWAWGSNEFNQLGIAGVSKIPAPLQIGNDSNWKEIYAGYGSSYAIKNDGTLWSWGANTYGQLGLGDTMNRSVPTKVGTDSDWSSVVSGMNFTLALKTDGTLWSWGINSSGTLGVGDTNNRNTPVKVGSASDWKFVSAGVKHALAIKKDSTLWAWGDDSNSSLGTIATGSVTVSYPMQVGSATGWEQVSAGNDFSLGINNGYIYGWGSNGYNQTGIDNSSGSVVHDPTSIRADKGWKSISAGDEFGMALKFDGTFTSFGRNDKGQLGDGLTGSFGSQISSTDWIAIESSHSHGIVQKIDGSLWSFGFNNAGRLGLGDEINRNIPTQIFDALPSKLGLNYETVSDSSVKLSWNLDPFSDTYLLKRNGITIYSGSDTEFIDSGISTPDAYTYEISGANEFGTGAASVLLVPVGLKKEMISLSPTFTGTVDDFETGTRTFPDEGTGNWFLVVDAYEGTQSFYSNTPIPGEVSTYQFTLSGPGKLSFWYNASIGNINDPFRIYMDSTKILERTSNSGWTYFEYDVPSGTHIIKLSQFANSAMPMSSTTIDNLSFGVSSTTPELISLPSGKYYMTEKIDDVSLVPFRLSTDNGGTWGNSVNGLSVFDSLSKGQNYANLLLEHQADVTKTFNYYYLDVPASSGELGLTTPGSSYKLETISAPVKNIQLSFTSPLSVADTRNSGDGWRLSVSSNSLSEVPPSGGFTNGYIPLSFPSGSLKLNAPSVSPVNGTMSAPPSINGPYWTIDDGNSHTVASAGLGNGMGDYEFTFPSNALEITVHSSSKLSDKLHYSIGPTPYESTVTWNVVSGP